MCFVDGVFMYLNALDNTNADQSDENSYDEIKSVVNIYIYYLTPD